MKSNFNLFKEMETMCEALRELMKDELEANRSRGLSEGRMKGLQEGLAEGRAEGQQQATDRLNALTLKLAELGRTDDIIKAASDTSYQKKLLEELGIS